MNVTASSISVLLFAQFHPKKEIGSNLLSRWGRIRGGEETWKITTNFLLSLQINISVSFWCCLSLSSQDQEDIIVTIYFRVSVPHSSAWLWLELRGIFLTHTCRNGLYANIAVAVHLYNNWKEDSSVKDLFCTVIISATSSVRSTLCNCSDLRFYLFSFPSTAFFTPFFF